MPAPSRACSGSGPGGTVNGWPISSQFMPAGTKVSEDVDITLKSKKYTDP